MTTNPFLVYTSNVFAILGLRSLYFVFAKIIDKFYYLRLGLAVILLYAGMKMIVTDIYHISSALSVLGIAGILAITMVASIMRARRVGQRMERIEEKKEAIPVTMGSLRDGYQQ